jgi:hypothetical protein
VLSEQLLAESLDISDLDSNSENSIDNYVPIDTSVNTDDNGEVESDISDKDFEREDVSNYRGQMENSLVELGCRVQQRSQMKF